MGKANYLIDGVSGSGKSAVWDALVRRGVPAINGDRELAYQGNPVTGERTEGFRHEHHLWDSDKVERLIASRADERLFFCGGCRNVEQFVALFDRVFILDVDIDTLHRRLKRRTGNDWGTSEHERRLVVTLHASGEG